MMRPALCLIVAMLCGLVWLKTGRDPIWWLIRALVILRAAVAQLSLETWNAAVRWWTAMPAAVERSRRECL